MNHLQRARDILNQEAYRLVLSGGDSLYFDTRRGVAPLLALLDQGAHLTGFAAADRVVGKAAAFLYLRMGVAAVYAGVMSTPAYDLLTAHGVAVTYSELTPAIRNRVGDGYCPMEQVCLPLADPVEAERAIRAKLAELTK